MPRRKKNQDLFKAPYRPVWSGEFEEMEVTLRRLMFFVPLSMGLIFILLYLALRSWLDAIVVLGNVLAASMGGVWALLLSNTNFSISAAVGFISLFGVAIMDGLLLISYFNTLRARGEPLDGRSSRGPPRRASRDDDRLDRLVRFVTGGTFHADRFGDAAAAGDRRGWGDGHNVAAYQVS